MNPIQPFLDEKGYLVLDGGLASELARRGANLNHGLWSARLVAEQPEAIIDVHRAYYDAGADLAISASYQASLDGFIKWGASPEDARRLLLRSVELARTARDQFWSGGRTEHGRPRALVAASVGPYGAVLCDGSEYHGDYGLTPEQLRDWHRPRLQSLVSAGPDLLAIETIPSVTEARILGELVTETTDTQALMSFVCRNDRETGEGQPIEEAAAVAQAQESVIAVGVNCTAPEHIEGILHRMAAVTDKPLVAYPNTGESWDAAHRSWVGRDGGPGDDDGPAEEWSPLVARWYEAGARLIGGCCRTTPGTIRTIARTLKGLAGSGRAQGGAR